MRMAFHHKVVFEIPLWLHHHALFVLRAGTRHVASVQAVTPDEVMAWACEYTTVGVVLIGTGPPCQGVSGLNADRKGSQRDARSSLYKEIPRVEQLVRDCFPWAQVHLFVESVDSMDASDRAAMSSDWVVWLL